MPVSVERIKHETLLAALKKNMFRLDKSTSDLASSHCRSRSDRGRYRAGGLEWVYYVIDVSLGAAVCRWTQLKKR